MKDVLEDLYYGRIIPFERPVNDSREAVKYRMDAHVLEKKLTAILPEEQGALLDQYYSMCSAECALNEKDAFLYGFRLGAQMLLEILK